MTCLRISLLGLTLAASFLVLASSGEAQPPGKKGLGPGKNDPAKAADMEVFHFLLDNRKDISRTIKEIDGGVETVTESAKPEIAEKIREHVAAMHKRIKSGSGIHLRDPLFAEIFRHYDQIEMSIDKTDKGVRVRETSKNEYVVKLIREHAKVVSGFIENGHEEVRKNHALPAPAKK